MFAGYALGSPPLGELPSVSEAEGVPSLRRNWGSKSEADSIHETTLPPCPPSKRGARERVKQQFVKKTPPYPAKTGYGGVYYSTMTKVPAVIKMAPKPDFQVNFSWRNTKASTSVMTTLSLSMGTTLDASPICRAR